MAGMLPAPIAQRVSGRNDEPQTGRRYPSPMTRDTSALLDHLQAFVSGYPRVGRTYGQFWEEFGLQAAELEAIVHAQDANAQVVERYYDLVDAAHDAYGCAPGRENELIG